MTLVLCQLSSAISERCVSPEDEHASSLKYIEAAYSGDIKPLRDLTQNFQVKLDVLIQYVERLKQAVSDRINYFHAGLILQVSSAGFNQQRNKLSEKAKNSALMGMSIL